MSYKILIFTVIASALFFASSGALAQVSGGAVQAGNSRTCQTEVCRQFEGLRGNFLSFIRWLYPMGIAIAVILSVFMIIFAGFQWMAGAISPPEIEKAKSKIGAALGGLFLALLSYLILNTINPDLVTLRRPDRLEFEGLEGESLNLDQILFGAPNVSAEVQREYRRESEQGDMLLAEARTELGNRNQEGCRDRIRQAIDSDLRRGDTVFTACIQAFQRANQTSPENVRFCVDRRTLLVQRLQNRRGATESCVLPGQ